MNQQDYIKSCVPTLCYYPRDAITHVSLARQECCLIYLGIPLRCDSPITHLKNLGMSVHPYSVRITIGRTSEESYNLVAYLSYDRKMGRRSLGYFRICGIAPYVVKDQVDLAHKIIRDYSIPRDSEQSMIEGEDTQYPQSITFEVKPDIPSTISIPKVNAELVGGIYTYARIIENVNTHGRQLTKSEMNHDATIRMTNKHLILHGEPGSGKTTSAKFILNHRFIVVEDIDTDLKRFNPLLHNGIIFENIDFREADLAYILCLTCCSEKIVRCGDVYITIPEDIQLIFTTPIEGGRIFDNDLRVVYDNCVIANITKKFVYEEYNDIDDDFFMDIPMERYQFVDEGRRCMFNMSSESINNDNDLSSSPLNDFKNRDAAIDESIQSTESTDTVCKDSIEDNTKLGNSTHDINDIPTELVAKTEIINESVEKLDSSNTVEIRQSARFVPRDQAPTDQDMKNRFKKTEKNNDMTPRENFYLGIYKVISKTKHNILYGIPGIGKTSLAKFYLDYRCLVVEDLDEDLKKFDPSLHDGIIFENIDFRKMNTSNVLQLVCMPDVVIPCGDVDVLIPKGTRLIFTTSIPGGRIFKDGLRQPYRVCKILNLKEEPYYDEDSSNSDELRVTDIPSERYA